MNKMGATNNRIAIILARGGSKRVPLKNIRPFCGQPMVTWVVRHTVESQLFSQVIISTDSEEIAQAAVSYGATYHGPRPPELSNDYATTAEVLQYVLNSLEKEGVLPEKCCCLYGTSAMVTSKILKQGLNLLNKPETELVISLMRYNHPIERALVVTENETVIYKKPEYASIRTQDLTEAYYDAGLFYWLHVPSFLKQNRTNFSSLVKRGCVVSRFDTIDIDTEEEWREAEKLARMHNLNC